jgi:hypothetical protein
LLLGLVRWGLWWGCCREWMAWSQHISDEPTKGVAYGTILLSYLGKLSYISTVGEDEGLPLSFSFCQAESLTGPSSRFRSITRISVNKTLLRAFHICLLNKMLNHPQRRQESGRSEQRHRSILKISRVFPEPVPPKAKGNENRNDMIHGQSSERHRIGCLDPERAFFNLPAGDPKCTLLARNTFPSVECVRDRPAAV